MIVHTSPNKVAIVEARDQDGKTYYAVKDKTPIETQYSHYKTFDNRATAISIADLLDQTSRIDWSIATPSLVAIDSAAAEEMRKDNIDEALDLLVDVVLQLHATDADSFLIPSPEALKRRQLIEQAYKLAKVIKQNSGPASP